MRGEGFKGIDFWLCSSQMKAFCELLVARPMRKLLTSHKESIGYLLLNKYANTASMN